MLNYVLKKCEIESQMIKQCKPFKDIFINGKSKIDVSFDLRWKTCVILFNENPFFFARFDRKSEGLRNGGLRTGHIKVLIISIGKLQSTLRSKFGVAGMPTILH